MMLYSCTHMATVGVKGLTCVDNAAVIIRVITSASVENESASIRIYGVRKVNVATHT